MRPLRLELENFTAFRTRQSLDLSGCDLFAISGPTGSGKSSILDALVFALYGRVPRMGSSCLEMISLGRDRMSVLLDFTAGGQDYRVTRVLRRRAPTTVQLERLADGTEEPLADGARNVNAEVERLVGLGYDAFLQAVILPQGEFARFLKSKPAERQEILRDLLRLSVYEKMKQAARQNATALQGSINNLEGLLASEYKEATPETIAGLEAEQETTVAEAGALAHRVTQAEAELAELRRRRALTVELETSRGRLDALLARGREITVLEARLDAARRAAGVVPLLDAADRSRDARERDQRRAAEAAGAARSARLEHEQTTLQLARAEGDAAELTALDARIEALAEAVTLASLLADAAPRAREAHTAHEQATREHAAATRDAAAARSEAARLQEAAVTTGARLASIAYDPERHRRLDDGRERATGIASLRTTLRRAGAERLSSQAELERAQRVVDAASDSAARATSARDRCEAARAAAEDVLREAEQANAVARLRHEMQPGEPCPVCERAVTSIPRAPGHVDLAALERARQRATEDERAAREAETAARGAAAAAQQGLLTAETALCRAGDNEAEARASVDHAVGALWREVGDLLGPAVVEAAEPEPVSAASGGRRARGARVKRQSAALPLFGDDDVPVADVPPRRIPPMPGDVLVETLLLDALVLLSTLRSQHEDARLAHDAAERASARAEADAATKSERLRHLERALDEAARAAQATRAAADDLQSRIAGLGASSDPAKERRALVAQRTALAGAVDTARRAERETSTALMLAEAQERETAQQLQHATVAADAALQQVVAAAREAAFADAQAARAAFVPLPEQTRLQAEIQAHGSERASCESRVAEINAALGDARVDAAALAAAEDACATLRQTQQALVHRQGSLEQRLREVRRLAAAAVERQADLRAARERHALQKQLADDLRSDQFQAYLLAEAFRELVAGASVRLHELSSRRYTLDFHEDAFHVLDHDNARERRSAETLSGGETFLASLALALELSQQVQRAAGAMDLDSLFIDEGFGTLDAETLDTIADAILSLPQSGRMVGIITHIAELTERLPARVRIEKRPEGSTISVER